MRDINTITLTGRLVHDPVLNRSASGGCLGHFVLASIRWVIQTNWNQKRLHKMKMRWLSIT